MLMHPNQGSANLNDYIDLIYQHRRLTNNGDLVCALELSLQERFQQGKVVAYSNYWLALLAIFSRFARDEVGRFLLDATCSNEVGKALDWFSDLRVAHINWNNSSQIEIPGESKDCHKNDVAIIQVTRDNISDVHNLACGDLQLVLIYDFDFAEQQLLFKSENIIASVVKVNSQKNIFDGCFVMTQSPSFNAFLTETRNFGYVPQGKPISYSLGFNAKMNEVHAAFFLQQLALLDKK